jgi:molybdopterin-guanine dinucleotide biosynthesis protein A
MGTQLSTPSPQPLTAIILIGGKSSRMGQPKALLPFDEEPLIVHSVRALQEYFSEIVVVAAPGQELPALPVTVVHDEVAYQGPVGGILYGLRAAAHEICFVTSCDAPFRNLALIRYLVSLIEHYDVVVPFWEERLQPLQAVYRRSVAPLLQDQLQRNELRPVFLYSKVRTYEVPAEDIRRFDPEGLSFRNMNTPADYQAALTLWRQRSRELSCVVELFGVARMKAKAARIPLTLPRGATIRDALGALADVAPVLVHTVIAPDRHSLLAGFACNLNGVQFLQNDFHTELHTGDSLLILSSDAGG